MRSHPKRAKPPLSRIHHMHNCKNLRTFNNMWRCYMKHLFQQFCYSIMILKKERNQHKTTSIWKCLVVFLYGIMWHCCCCCCFFRFFPLLSRHISSKHVTLFDFADENIIFIYTNSNRMKIQGLKQNIINNKQQQQRWTKKINANPTYIGQHIWMLDFE